MSVALSGTGINGRLRHRENVARLMRRSLRKHLDNVSAGSTPACFSILVCLHQNLVVLFFFFLLDEK